MNRTATRIPSAAAVILITALLSACSEPQQPAAQQQPPQPQQNKDPFVFDAKDLIVTAKEKAFLNASITALRDAVKSGDFEPLHSRFSPSRQAELTPAQLKKQFAPLKSNVGLLDAATAMDVPALEELTQFQRYVGRYPTQPHPLKFVLVLDRTGASWKLADFQVEVVP